MLRFILLLISFISIPGIIYGDAFGKESYLFISTGIIVSLILLIQLLKKKIYYTVNFGDILIWVMILFILAGVNRLDNSIFIVLFLMITAWSVSKIKDGKVFIYIFLFLGIVHASIGLKQIFIFYNAPVSGLFNNSGVYANYLAPIFALSFGLFLWERKRLIKIAYCLCFSLLAIVIVFTQARTGILSIIVSTVFLLAIKYNFKKRFFKFANNSLKWVAIAITAIFICATCLWGIAGLRPDSVKGRLLIYRVSAEMIAQKPLFGHGVNTFRTLYPNCQANYFENNPDSILNVYADNTKTAFNEFVQIFTELGIVGFLLSILILYYLFSIPVTVNNKKEIILWKATLLSLVVTGVFSYPLRNIVTAVNVAFIIGILASYDKRELFLFKFSKSSVILICIISLSVTSYFGNRLYAQYKGHVLWTGFINNKLATNDEVIKRYRQVYPLLKTNGLFLYNYAVQLSALREYEHSNIILNETLTYYNDMDIWLFMGDNYKGMNNYNDAERCYVHASNIIPCRFYPLYKLAKLYEQTKNNTKLYKTANLIIDKPIKVPSYTVTAIKNKMRETLKRLNDE